MATAKKKHTTKRTKTKTNPVKHTSQVKSVASMTSPDRRFMQAKFTEQTIYWLIIGAAVIGLAVWVLSLQVKMNEMYDDMDAAANSTVIPQKSNQ